MSLNTIFVIITSILALAVVIYLIAIKKGKEQQKAIQQGAEDQDDEDEL